MNHWDFNADITDLNLALTSVAQDEFSHGWEWRTQLLSEYVWCKHNSDEVIGHIVTANGLKQYKYGCPRCGRRTSGCLKRNDLTLKDIANADENDHNAVEDRYRSFCRTADDLINKHAVRLKSEANDEWNRWRLARYEQEDWWGPNGWVERIMKRSGGQCECCLLNKAKEVHHLTYIHLYKERAWELQAVCHDCHRRITIEDRAERGRDYSDVK